MCIDLQQTYAETYTQNCLSICLTDNNSIEMLAQNWIKLNSDESKYVDICWPSQRFVFVNDVVVCDLVPFRAFRFHCIVVLVGFLPQQGPSFQKSVHYSPVNRWWERLLYIENRHPVANEAINDRVFRILTFFRILTQRTLILTDKTITGWWGALDHHWAAGWDLSRSVYRTHHKHVRV